MAAPNQYRPGGYARAAQVHKRRRHKPDRRNRLLRQAAEAANLKNITYEHALRDGDRTYWFDICAEHRGQRFLIDLKVKKTNERDREIRVEKDSLAAELGIPLLVIRDDSSQAVMQGQIEIFKLRLSAGQSTTTHHD